MTVTQQHPREIIWQILDTWVGQLPIDDRTAESIATKEDVAHLSEQLISRLSKADESQAGHWMTLLVALYSTSRFRETSGYQQA